MNWLRRLLARRAAVAAPAGDARAPLEAWLQAADARYRAGDATGAQQLCQRILDANPDHAPALFLLGEMAEGRGDHDEAAGLLRRAVSIADGEAHYHYALGCVLGSAGAWRDAAQSYRAALARDPGHAGAQLNLGTLLQAHGEQAAATRATHADGEAMLAEALSHFQSVVAIAPEHADGWLNLGYALARHGRLEEARENYDRALALDPGHVQARFNRSLVLLALGEYPAGWRDYESRWQAGPFARPDFDGPEWDGASPAGRTLLLHAEQGYGDAIQFVRYAALLAARQARVVVRCPPELVRLLAGAAGVQEAVSPPQPLPAYDAHCALLGLPRLLGTTVETIPSEVPYLRVPRGLLGEWRERAAAAGGGLKVGLVWASQSVMPNVELKSMSLDTLAPLGQVAGVTFYSLQLGAAGAQARDPAAPLALRDLTGHIRDFADTAALLSSLDLTITVDTAVAHLAGALGLPVWTLLPHAADWRWEPGAKPERWYPTMRLFRQPQRGDWPSAVSGVAHELQRLAGATRARS